jgi:hypothetical protein
MALTKTPTKKVTYNGRRALVCEYRTFGPASLRVAVVQWIDAACERNGNHPAGTTVLRLIEGTTRKGNFVHHDALVIADLAPGLANIHAEHLVRAHTHTLRGTR